MKSSRCDLHLHSAASIGNDEWYSRFFGCPESYADPARQYELCKARGMTLVTLTDHDTIAGGLTLLDRPDFFLSEEVTAVFPDNGCVMHVLAWNITPAQHEEIQTRRRDIYRLCEYLNREQIAHGLAHPLLSPSWNLDAETFEKLLLLFPTFEAVNGLTDRRIEPDLTTLLDRLTPKIIASLAAKHGIPAYGRTPHRKALTAGSDDHVHRRCGTVFVEIDEPNLGAKQLVGRCMAGEAHLRGEQAHLHAMAMCIKHTTYHYFTARGAEAAGNRNPFVDLMDVIAGRETETCREGDTDFVAALLGYVQQAAVGVGDGVDIRRIPDEPSESEDARIINGVSRLADKLIEGALGDLLTAAQDFDIYGLFKALRDLAGGLVSVAPAFFAADHFGKQEQQVRRVYNQWRAFPLPSRPERLALFSDSLHHVDGVSTWCRRFVEQARAYGCEVLVPDCSGGPGYHHLPALTSGSPPLYPDIRFYVPSLIDALTWVWQERISHIEVATPGPMGLVGLLVAKVLRLPVTASYHTEVPALVTHLGGNAMMERTARRYLAWFYAQVDRLFAFSAGSRDTLVEMGVAPDKISIMPAVVDPTDFSPAHRSTVVFEALNLDVGDRPVILSVGRLSNEKNLPVIVEAVERVQGRLSPPVLVVVGDGPERSALEARCRHLEFVRFAGVHRGDILRKLYASASVFVFASRVDTLGLVNMEAMASGIPVLVPSDAAIAEFVTDGISAECYPFGPLGLAEALTRVLDDPLRAAKIGAGGRQAIIERSRQAPFAGIWKSYTEPA